MTKANQGIPEAKLGAADIAGSVGFGLMLSILLVCFMSSGMGASAAGDPVLFAWQRASGMIAFAAALALSQFFSDSLSRRAALPRLLAASTLLVAAGAGLLFFMGAGMAAGAAGILCWLAMGAGLGLAFALWPVFSAMLDDAVVPVATAASFLIAGLWAGFVLQVSSELQPAAVVVSVVLSALLFAGYLRECALPAAITRDESRARVHLSVRTSIAICCYGVVAVLAFQFLASFDGATGALVACGAFSLAALGSLAIVAVSREDGDPFSFSHSQRYAFPLLIAGLMPLAMGWTGMVAAIALGLVLVGYFFLDVFNWTTLSSLASRYRSQPIYLFSVGRAPLGAGLALGWIAVAVGETLAPVGGTVAFATQPLVAAVAVVALAVSVAIAPYGSDTLTQKRDADKLREDPMYSQSVKGGLFRRACLALSEQYQLTPREREVFLLLAKGRSASVVQEELSISPGTVRTHSYHIYRKLGVSSQQELISVVEETIAQNKVQA